MYFCLECRDWWRRNALAAKGRRSRHSKHLLWFSGMASLGVKFDSECKIGGSSPFRWNPFWNFMSAS